MRYYDLIETPNSGKTFLEGGDNRLPQTDERVKNWFEPCPFGYVRKFDVDGFPLMQKLTLKENGTLYLKYNEDGTPDLVYETKQEALKYKNELKSHIQRALDTMRVELNLDGVVYGFDGDEISQTRLDKASRVLLPDGVTTIKWRLYDNTEESFTQTELAEVFTKASIVMSSLWFCSTEQEVLAIVSTDEQWLAKFNGV